MALKFLNKKGWHTGSLRNVENVWKAEQKHEAEQRKLEELRKQIQEERERSEFRALQEQAGLVPRQERLEFLYDSGLAVGRGASGPDGGGVAFKALQEDVPDPGSKSADKQSLVPGALFEEKPHSANDAWRKLHSDPLLLIRQREQEALARLKNNPVQMALIRKSVEEKKHKEKDRDNKEGKKKHHHSSKKHHHSHSKQHRYSSSKNYSDAEDDGTERKSRKSSIHKKSSYGKHYERREPDSENESSETGSHRKNLHKGKYRDRSPIERREPKTAESYGPSASKRVHDKSKHEEYSYKGRMNHDSDEKSRENVSSYDVSVTTLNRESQYRRRNSAPKLSEEERAARLREMQQDAVLHEEQRWKRLRKAEENDAREAKQANISSGRNFLDAAHKSVYGAEKGGSSTIEESVRRRTHYLQGRSEAEGNAFRR